MCKSFIVICTFYPLDWWKPRATFVETESCLVDVPKQSIDCGCAARSFVAPSTSSQNSGHAVHCYY